MVNEQSYFTFRYLVCTCHHHQQIAFVEAISLALVDPLEETMPHIYECRTFPAPIPASCRSCHLLIRLPSNGFNFTFSFTQSVEDGLLLRSFLLLSKYQRCQFQTPLIIMETNGHDGVRSALVLYGTETGTSQDLAEEVGRSLERLLFDVDLAECDRATLQDLTSYDLTVLLISTTGQGDFPSNSRKLWISLLRKRLPQTLLTRVNYALVGLCDSSYIKFNWAARKLEKRLRQLGAHQIVESCEADEQGDNGTDGAFLAWLDDFRSAVLAQFSLPAGKEPIPESQDLPGKWILQRASAACSNGETEVNGQSSWPQKSPPILPDCFPATLQLNDRVTPTSHWQDVRLLRLRTTKPVVYLPGDALAISPENMPQDVKNLIDLMGWHDVADALLVVKSNSGNMKASRLRSPPIALRPDQDQITLQELLSRYLDINAIPRRSFFASIAKYTTDSMHKERLLEFTDPQYLDEYYDYATRPRRSIIEILQEFDTVRIPWQEVVNVFPALRPRQFSIASGGTLNTSNDGTVFELLVAIVKYRTVIKRIREGVCTRFLAQLPTGTVINVALRTEGRFASDTQLAHNNHLLIGAGTGIAPLRALIHDKAVRSSDGTSTTLVFGARNAASDYFFSQEWKEFAKPRHSRLFSLEVFPAFSRDQKQKVYVQDRIREEAERLHPLLVDSNTVVIVCGASGAMPKAVRQALVDVLGGSASISMSPEGKDVGKNSFMTPEDAEKFISNLEKEGRYKQETWS